MTPEEKAKELVESFAETILPTVTGSLMERNWHHARECALIAVDAVIKQVRAYKLLVQEIFISTNEDHVEYWQKVKRIIENEIVKNT